MEKENIQILEEIKRKKYDFSEVDKKAIVEMCLNQIGNQNSAIRDDLIYGILAHLFYDQLFNEDELTVYMERLFSEAFLSYDMENKETYSVLVRSFSVLQLVILVYVHRRDNIIEKPVIEKLYQTFITYFDQEKILIGYDLEVGWLHAIAHSADLFSELMQITWFDEAHLKTMFDAIANKVKQENYYFMFNEDERLVVAIKKGIERQILPQAYILSWLDQFVITDTPNVYPQLIFYNNNIKCFLRS